MTRAVVVILGPSREAISGVTTHLNLLFASPLARDFTLIHFQVGSEGRREGAARRALRLAASPFLLAHALLRHGAAVVHLNTSLNAGAFWRDLAYLAVAKTLGARVVYQVHGGALPQRFLPGRIGARLLRAVLRAPDVIVVLASAEHAAYRAFVPEQPLACIPNGIDDTPFAAAPRTPRSEPLRLLYFGRLAPGKGLAEILEAFATLKARGSSASLVIAGSGSEESALRAQAQGLGIADAVTFAGPAFGADKARLLAAADVLLLPSYSEGLPYALLEAMAAGVVPVVTRVGAMPDVVEDGVHGSLIAPRNAHALAEAIERLDADRAALARMSEAARRRVAAGFSLVRVAADFATLYSGLCAARTPRTAP